MGTSEWVDYSTCPRDARHVRLGPDQCPVCTQPTLDRSLSSAGKFHWLVWQQNLTWTGRYAPERPLELTAADYAAWAAADPAGHRAYLDFLAGSAAFRPDDVRRPTRGYLLAPGEPPTTLILQPDGGITRPDHSGPARWAVDAAGVLVLSMDRSQVRIVGRRGGLHVGRRAGQGSATGQPAFLGVWSDEVTATGLRVTAHSANALLGSGRDLVERDLFLGDGPRMSVLGPERRVRVEADTARRRVTYRSGPRRIGLDGGPVSRGAGDYADWRLVFLRPLV